MNATPGSVAKFPLGRLLATPNALNRLTQDEILSAIIRHQSGDWGNVDEDDRKKNELSLQEGSRLLSVYQARNGVTFWIITEANLCATTVLMPEDY